MHVWCVYDMCGMWYLGELTKLCAYGLSLCFKYFQFEREGLDLIAAYPPMFSALLWFWELYFDNYIIMTYYWMVWYEYFMVWVELKMKILPMILGCYSHRHHVADFQQFKSPLLEYTTNHQSLALHQSSQPRLLKLLYTTTPKLCHHPPSPPPPSLPSITTFNLHI